MRERASESMSQRLRAAPAERSERGGETGSHRSTGRVLLDHPVSPLREGVR